MKKTIEFIFSFIKKNFNNLRSSIFTLLLGCSFLLNISLFLYLGNSLFDKIILATAAGCIQFFGVYCIFKAKAYLKEIVNNKEHPIFSFFKSLLNKTVGGIFLVLYITAVSVSLMATYSFSLNTMYQSSNKEIVLITNEATIAIKNSEIAAKDIEIAAQQELMEKLSPTASTTNNSELITDYSAKIINSEQQISKLRDELRSAQNALSNDPENKDIKAKITTINASIASENANIVSYTNKKKSLEKADKDSVNSSKKDLEDYQNKYNELTVKITKLNEAKIAIQAEINKLIEEDQNKLRETNKTQYKLVAENLTSILYPEKQEETKKQEITEEQVRAVLLAIFSLMMEIGIFVCAEEETKEEKKPIKSKKIIKLDKNKKKEDTLIKEVIPEKALQEILSKVYQPNIEYYINTENVETEPVLTNSSVEEIKKIDSIPEENKEVVKPMEMSERIDLELNKKKNKIKIPSLEKEAEKMMAEIKDPIKVQQINI